MLQLSGAYQEFHGLCVWGRDRHGPKIICGKSGILHPGIKFSSFIAVIMRYNFFIYLFTYFLWKLYEGESLCTQFILLYPPYLEQRQEYSWYAISVIESMCWETDTGIRKRGGEGGAGKDIRQIKGEKLS